MSDYEWDGDVIDPPRGITLRPARTDALQIKHFPAIRSGQVQYKAIRSGRVAIRSGKVHYNARIDRRNNTRIKHYNYTITAVQSGPHEPAVHLKNMIGLLQTNSTGSQCKFMYCSVSLIATLARLLHDIGKLKTAVLVENKFDQQEFTRWTALLKIIQGDYLTIINTPAKPFDPKLYDSHDVIFYMWVNHLACCAKTYDEHNNIVWQEFGFYGEFADHLPPVTSSYTYRPYDYELGVEHNGRCVTLSVLFALVAAHSMVTHLKPPPGWVFPQNPDPYKLYVAFGLYQAALCNQRITATRTDDNPKAVKADLIKQLYNENNGTTFKIGIQTIYPRQRTRRESALRGGVDGCAIMTAFVDITV